MNRIKQSIITNAGLLISGRIVDKISALIIAIILARFIGIEKLGIYYLAILYIDIFYTLTNLGIDLFLTRELSVDHSNINKLYSQGFIFKIIVSFLSILLLMIIIILSPYPHQAKPVIIWSSLIIIIDSINGLYGALFISKQLVKYEALALIFEKIVTLIIILLICIHIKPDLFLIFTIFILVKLLAGLIRYSCQKKFICAKFSFFNYHEFFDMLKKNVVYALTHLFSKIYLQIDILLLSYLSVMTSIGLYQASARLILGIMVIPQTLTVNLIPYIARNFIDNIHLVKKININTNRILIFISGIFFITFFIYSKELLVFLYGDDFSPASLVFKIMAVSIPFRFVSYLFEAILTSYNMQKERLKGVFFCAIINLILNFILIKYFDYLGAGIATLTTAILLTLIYLHYLLQKINFMIEMLKLILIFFIIFMVDKFLEIEFTFISIIVSLIIYLVFSFISRMVLFTDFKGLLHDKKEQKN
jgi:O-antigen/teichoic acid export membrane protein